MRIFLAKGELPSLAKIQDACRKRGIKLHRNYGAMMDKLTLSYEPNVEEVSKVEP